MAASAFGTVLVSWMLLKRFLHTGDELAIRTDELRRTYEERQQIQEELVHQEQLAAVGELSAIIAHEGEAGARGGMTDWNSSSGCGEEE